MSVGAIVQLRRGELIVQFATGAEQTPVPVHADVKAAAEPKLKERRQEAITHCVRAESLIMQRKFREATKALCAALQLDPSFLKARTYLYFCLDTKRLPEKKGDVEAQRKIGEWFFNGVGVTRDYIKAFTWFWNAAEKNDPIAHYHLSLMRRDGMGCSQNETVSRKHLEKAALLNHPQALYELGQVHHREGRYTSGRLLFVQAAAQGHAQAATQLGLIYWHGVRIQQSEHKAEEMFKKGAELGDPRASECLENLQIGRLLRSESVQLHS